MRGGAGRGCVRGGPGRRCGRPLPARRRRRRHPRCGLPGPVLRAPAMEEPPSPPRLERDALEPPEGCPSPLELKSGPSKKMWVKLRAL